ncbi:hypothetical protein NHX12_007862 [Muraenolepis orangiensis]|uniref:Endoplasmic reticulum junction formation protein lunapark n=1 Tax=Muraenolepis orangiensis TaxID=630683 RepID=A0A9Q0IBY9_9TELE|nr:hypothetical protein NHX12_007862 [Muraenolepis orangiensis]
MGAVVSRWKSKPSTVEVLESIDKDMHRLEEHGTSYQKQLGVWVGRLLRHSCLLYLLSCVVVYLWYLPERTVGRVVLALPFVLFPLLVWFLRRMLIALYARRTRINDEKLEELKVQKRKILEDVMETETYKNAKLILERFDPDAKKMELNSSLISAHMTPNKGPGQELRQRNVAPPLSVPRGLSAEAVATHPSLMRRSLTPSTAALGAGMHPPGPPLARPVLPRDRGTMDRVIEYLVGYGPQNRYALICQQCLSHNGMALKEEFEYVAFRCAYCYLLNPARKTRPQAPRLPENPDLAAASEGPAVGPAPGGEVDCAKAKLEFPAEVEEKMEELKPWAGEAGTGPGDQEVKRPEEQQQQEEGEEVPSEKSDEDLHVSLMEVE